MSEAPNHINKIIMAKLYTYKDKKALIGKLGKYEIIDYIFQTPRGEKFQVELCLEFGDDAMLAGMFRDGYIAGRLDFLDIGKYHKFTVNGVFEKLFNNKVITE